MKRINLLACLTLALAAPVYAQDAPPSPPRNTASADSMDLVRDKVRAGKKALVEQNVGLTEAEAKAFWPIYEAFQTDLGKLADRTVRLVDFYVANYRSLTDTAANRMMDEHLALERDRAALLTSYRQRFRPVLPPIKLARYYQTENKIRAIVEWELAKRIPLM
jgi:hypothetical protein